MADHADQERAQGPAANLDAAVVGEADTPSDQEMAGPMLDVHAPATLTPSGHGGIWTASTAFRASLSLWLRRHAIGASLKIRRNSRGRAAFSITI